VVVPDLLVDHHVANLRGTARDCGDCLWQARVFPALFGQNVQPVRHPTGAVGSDVPSNDKDLSKVVVGTPLT
jgi:hypothetical protein